MEFSSYLSTSVKLITGGLRLKPVTSFTLKEKDDFLLRISGGHDMHFSLQKKGEGTIAHFLYFQCYGIRLQGKLPNGFCRNVIADLFY